MPFERKNKNPGKIFPGGHTYVDPPFSAKRKSLGYFLKEFDVGLMEKFQG